MESSAYSAVLRLALSVKSDMVLLHQEPHAFLVARRANSALLRLALTVIGISVQPEQEPAAFFVEICAITAVLQFAHRVRAATYLCMGVRAVRH